MLRHIAGRGAVVGRKGREVRYSFLNRVADAVGVVKIATGHTADDQAETFLMRLFARRRLGGALRHPSL